MKPQRKFKGVWIPRAIWTSPKLTWLEKCLLAEIDCLSEPGSPCSASNDYLAGMFGVTAKRIANMLPELRARGFLKGDFSAEGRKLVVVFPRESAAGDDGSEVEETPPQKTVAPEPVKAVAQPAKADAKNNMVEFPKAASSHPGTRATPSRNPGRAIPESGINHPGIRDDHIGREKDKRKDIPDASASGVSPHTQFIRRWGVAYEEFHGRPYAFQGGKDASAVKRLLGTARLSPDDLLAVAAAAWALPNLFNCKQAVSIAGFAGRFNEIAAELRTRGVVVAQPAVRHESAW